MKFTDFIFKHFDSIPSKQWKQKVQYQLQGEDYQKALIAQHEDGVSSLPFYTFTEVPRKLCINIPKLQQSMGMIEVTTLEETIQTARTYIEKGVNSLHFTIYKKTDGLAELFNHISVPVFINCHFLNATFKEELINSVKNNNITLLIDPIGKLAQTGNWFANTKKDFEHTTQILNSNPNSLTINAALYHNAGASVVQQLAYSFTQLYEYNERIDLKNCSQINYTVSVSTDAFLEIAKLKSLRILHQSICNALQLTATCNLILQKSKRNVLALHYALNMDITNVEYTIGIAGGADFVANIPQGYIYFKEDQKHLSSSLDSLILKLKNTEDTVLLQDNYHVEKLTQQLIKKTTELLTTIAKGGGFVNQLKKGIIQQKITASFTKFQSDFTVQNDIQFSNLPLKTSIRYPFLKFKQRKTLFVPIIEKRLATPLEQPIWKKQYSNEKP